MPRYQRVATLLVVEAVKWDGLPETANRLVGEGYGCDWEYAAPGSSAITLCSFGLGVEVGDYILKHPDGRFSGQPPVYFEAHHEPISE